MDINHISISRKRCFDECPQMYKYRYHLKVPRPDEEPFYFTYGKIIHKIAELYVEGNGKTSLGDVTTEILRGKIEIEKGVTAPPLPDDYKRKLPGHIRSIQSLTDRIGTDGIVEYEFRYDLDPPNQRCVTGFIDRLIIKENKAWIIDYKTTKKGKWRHTPQSIKTDPQLCMYARVIHREFKIEPQNISTALYYVEGPQLVPARFTKQSLEKVEQELLKTYKLIEMADPDKVWGNVGEHCKRCDYRNMCPFYKPPSKKELSWDGDFGNLGSL